MDDVQAKKKLAQRKAKYEKNPDGRCLTCWYLTRNCHCPIERPCRRCGISFEVMKKDFERDYICPECVREWAVNSPFAVAANRWVHD